MIFFDVDFEILTEIFNGNFENRFDIFSPRFLGLNVSEEFIGGKLRFYQIVPALEFVANEKISLLSKHQELNLNCHSNAANVSKFSEENTNSLKILKKILSKVNSLLK